MADLSRQRCLNHSGREAAAKCPQCSHFYCRECITEHEDKIICASCLEKQFEPDDKKKKNFGKLLKWSGAFFGIVLIWLFFFFLGKLLLLIPSAFHEGSIWQ